MNNQNLTYKFPKGHKPWNKGLTKEKDVRVKKLAEMRLREKHPLWKGGRTRTHGYVKILMPEHQDAQIGGYVLEHRLVMEKMLGRRLESFEEVHHKNGVKNDNRPENLELTLKRKHYGEISCPFCQKTFKIK